MLRKRLIFVLLWDGAKFALSRNFSPQAVGDLEWLRTNYDWDSIATSIDELVVLNICRDARVSDEFCAAVRLLARRCFIPLACGGGVRSVEDAYRLLAAGADKVVVTTLAHEDPEVVRRLVARFGSQFVVGALDYKLVGDARRVLARSARVDTGLRLEEGVAHLEGLGAGELLINSVNQDGTGRGFDLEALRAVGAGSRLPVIAAGGAGTPEHFLQAIRIPGVSAVATANLFNFMAGGLADARAHLRESGVDLASFGR